MSTAARAFALNAPAKLNLRLEVGRLSGRLHRVSSVLAELELADVVRFEPAPSGFQVLCEGALLPERDNLAWRAAQALELPLPDVRVIIDKHIPLQAGLGGGSSDAAATLQGLARFFSQNGMMVPDERIANAARQTGSDVPSFLVSGLRIVSGVGDIVVARDGPVPSWGIVLLRPAAGSSTEAAYALLDAAGVPHPLGPEAMSAAEMMCDTFLAGDLDGFIALLHNDFAQVLERELPAIASARERLERAGARGTILCGSGSCVAGFFASDALAHEAVARIPQAHGEWIQATRFSGG